MLILLVLKIKILVSMILSKIYCNYIKIAYGQKIYDLYLSEKFRPLKLLRFEVHVTDHCNLNCAGCFHFSNISPVSFLDIKQFQNDCEQLSKLTGGKCDRIHLMGGEPLLNPSLNENQKVIRNFNSYHRVNTCIQLRNGKLYPCVPVAYIDIFNLYFNKKLIVSKRDFIDIYKVKSIEEIFRFLSRPIPFCRYCNIDATVRDIDWSITKKEISEWV